uniref:Uncharacterized protein n=1 Tax=Meloidogyne enterolobii TaxID=390850 RepID=A0A6V7Y935_MELEN|nr:unnamed protein product [Meloidogyne enterolobii]
MLAEAKTHFLGLNFRLKRLNLSNTLLKALICSSKLSDLVKIKMSSTYAMTLPSPVKTCAIILAKALVAF